jgi:putative ATP-binding cassette transporter
LHRPRWVVIDEALDALKGDARQRVFSLLEQDLSDSAIINIGQVERGRPFFQRELNLAIDPHGRTLKPVQLHPVERTSHRKTMAAARAG